MKKLIVLFVCASLFSISNASSTILTPPKLNAKDVLIPVGKLGNKISILELSRISTSDFQKLTGEKMTWFNKLSFKATQHKLKQNIDQNGTFNRKRMAKYFGSNAGSAAGGFALGLFLSFVGVAIAYLIKDEHKHTRVSWAWLGFTVGLAILLIVALTSDIYLY